MYDYIIVGAGSAGCVLANRLTEDPGVTVLLLEAGGPDDRIEIHVPLAASLLFKSEYDWAYMTEAQPHLGRRSLYWPRGKMLGGSSSLNALVYIRGHPSIYDRWAEAGNAGWSFREVLPYFKRAENQERGPSEFHGVGGPLNVADNHDVNPISRAFVAACEEIGLPRNDDFNGPEQTGFGFFQITTKDGQRCSTAVGYLRPAMARPNLTVQTFAHATRILFDGRRAAGVTYVQEGETHRAEARREVVLAGGAVNSPQLLLLSGVGPADQLRSLDIPVVAHLPGVGQNLQDHLIVAVTYHCTEPITLANAETPEALEQYVQFGRGPLCSNGGEAGGFMKINPEATAPDLQFHFTPSWYIQHGFADPDGHGITFSPTLLLPESRGCVSLRSRDPLAPPRIQPNYFAHDADLEVLVAGVKVARKLAASCAFARFAGAEHTPGSHIQTDEEIRAFVRESAETVYHPCGTCKMGRDAMAVVDEQLRVHGMQGLRVVDASIMPSIVNGNTNAPTIMIAEKAADMIKAAQA